MKKIILFLILFTNIVITYSQDHVDEEHSFELLYGKKVIINKTVVSYTLLKSKVNNDKLSNTKIKSDINIPFYIFIKSNNSSASIRINSKKLREDIFMEFKCIHKVVSYDYTTYDFYGYKNQHVSYIIPKDGSHHSLSIRALDQNKNGEDIDFTISKYDQL